MNWRIAFVIARKDIADALKNMTILFSLVLPIGLSLLWNVVFPHDNGDLNTLTVAVYDPGGSRLVAMLRESPDVRLLETNSEQQLAAEVAKKAVGGLAMPVGFDQAVAAGERPELTVYINGRRGGGEKAAFQIMVERQLWALAGYELPIRVKPIDVSKSREDQARGEFRMGHYFLIVLMVMNLAGVGAFVVPTLLAEEKEKHTLEVLLLSPAGPAEVVVGKALTGLTYCLLIAGILIGLNRGWAGNWPVTLLAVLLGALFAVLVGLLSANLFHTISQVNTWSTIVLLVLMVPTWFTIQGVLPAPLETAFRVIPTYHLSAVLGLALAGKASLARVWGNLAVLAGSVIVAFAVVVWTLGREEK